MARGPKKHLKRLNAPKHWMLDKLGGVFAPKPSAGPHKTRECLPLCLILRNRLKYALTYKEVTTILMQRLVKIDGKTRVDKCYPAGFMGEYREAPLSSHPIARFSGEKKDPMADRKPHPISPNRRRFHRQDRRALPSHLRLEGPLRRAQDLLHRGPGERPIQPWIPRGFLP